MDMELFLKKVKAMREAQKKFFYAREKKERMELLGLSKQLEKEVDMMIANENQLQLI